MANSQCEKILEALMNGESITPQSAVERFGCMRLAARIADLKQRGYPIRTDIVKYREYQGKRTVTKRYAKYYLGLSDRQQAAHAMAHQVSAYGMAR